ncbi:GntR family transcriptional regulator [Kribbella sp. NPDC049227]|uniref:GntR family transcriptional regulator n=1 Tax=Kribbella sp. NPDC049227 TaxID=3364113 RepID=UPI003720533C
MNRTEQRDLADTAYEALRDDIAEWRLAPGTSLAEVETSARLGMSRTPVRQALRRLHREGLAQPAGRGFVVAPVSVDGVIALFQAREALEVYAMRLAAHAVDRAAFGDLAARYDQAARRKTVDADAIYALSAEFDQAVDRAANNAYITEMLTQLRVHLHRLRRLSRHRLDRLRVSAQQHVAIARAIESGNERQTAQLASDRLRDSLDIVLQSLSTSLIGPDDRAPAPLGVPST